MRVALSHAHFAEIFPPRRGDYGPKLQKEWGRFVMKHPVSAPLLKMTLHLADQVDGPVAGQIAPIPDDPTVLARHIKQLCYFLRADPVGIRVLPRYAVYSCGHPSEEPVELEHKNAIAIIVHQDWPTAHALAGHDWISNAMSFLSYSTTAFISCIVTD